MNQKTYDQLNDKEKFLEKEKLEHRYEIYVECMNCCAFPQDIKSFDEWHIKSFDEWLDSKRRT
jgi:hypothetical protein|tara:strand:- start:306 stop:494 length:189 start_codon:yes stop_codon:yes gene_type:complete